MRSELQQYYNKKKFIKITIIWSNNILSKFA